MNLSIPPARPPHEQIDGFTAPAVMAFVRVLGRRDQWRLSWNTRKPDLESLPTSCWLS